MWESNYAFSSRSADYGMKQKQHALQINSNSCRKNVRHQAFTKQSARYNKKEGTKAAALMKSIERWIVSTDKDPTQTALVAQLVTHCPVKLNSVSSISGQWCQKCLGGKPCSDLYFSEEDMRPLARVSRFQCMLRNSRVGKITSSSTLQHRSPPQLPCELSINLATSSTQKRWLPTTEGIPPVCWCGGQKEHKRRTAFKILKVCSNHHIL